VIEEEPRPISGIIKGKTEARSWRKSISRSLKQRRLERLAHGVKNVTQEEQRELAQKANSLKEFKKA